MIITITLIAGLLLFTLQIVFHEIHQQIERIKTELEPITKDGGIYPKAKPIQFAELTRKLSTKPAPLYYVIKKCN